jgi:mannose-6-phosphate isomerase
MNESPEVWVSPLWFEPVFRQYLWGGRRLGEVLQKPIAATGRFAESWEVVDHGADQSTVAWGWASPDGQPHAGQADAAGDARIRLVGQRLGELMQSYGPAIVGPRWHAEIHSPSQPPSLRGRFPLLVKWLDAQQNLSLQVHPNSQQAALLDPPDLGKSEAWYVADAAPGARVYAGLLPGVDRAACEQAMAAGRLADVLYHFSPQAGDCIYIPAGTIHAIGAGLLVAEVQQASDTTYRLHDWDRVGDDGRPRALQIEQALAVADWTRGPVPAVIPEPAQLEADSLTGNNSADSSSDCEQLVDCPYFTLRRFHLQGTRTLPTGRCQILICLSGHAELQPVDGSEPANQARPTIQLGSTVLLPYACPAQQLVALESATFLLASLPALP